MATAKDSCLIIGFGRLGQTLANILNKKYKISVIEPTSANQNLAKDSGYKIVTKQKIPNYRTVFVCVPIRDFEGLIKEISPLIAENSLLIDTCSVKVYPIRIMKKHINKNVSILATHPMFGPDSVKNGLAGLGIVFCPIRIEDNSLFEWYKFWGSFGINVTQVTPEEHDKKIAYTLGLTHFIGRMLSNLNLNKDAITTVGFNALLDVVDQTTNDSWQLFYDMQHYNPYSKEMRNNLFSAINKVEKKLDDAIEG
jgi:prephenate dehydrogenase